MRGVKIDADLESRIKSCLLAGKSLRVAAAECGSNCGVVQRVLKEMRADGLAESVVAAPGVEPAVEEREWSEAGDKATVTVRTPEKVRTEADAIRVCGVDTSRWRVASMQIKTYQIGMKLTDKEQSPAGVVRRISERPHVVQLYGVTLKLELIAPRPYLDAMDLLYRRFEDIARSGPPPSPSPAAASPLLVNLGLYDVHFAKMCWGRETGQDYDLRLAETVYRNAGEDLVRLLSPYRVGRFVIAVGHDAFHVDSARNTTTLGTIVDCDSRYPKMIEVGSMSHVWLIGFLLRIAPVDVIYVPGNHDRLSSYHLCRFLSAWFRDTPGVSVDLSPGVRKYRRYGQCLFGFRHGDLLTDSQVPTLPGLMAVESPKDWAESTCREWFLGHRHTSRRFVSRESDELQGVQIRYLSSLSGTDAWHYENGYVGNRRAAEAYLYDLDRGYLGHFVAPARAS
jgi:hypothetical protein